MLICTSTEWVGLQGKIIGEFRLNAKGNSLLLLLPSEEKFIEQLKKKKIPITPILVLKKLK